MDSFELVIFLTIEPPLPPALSDIILWDLGRFINFSTSPMKSTLGNLKVFKSWLKQSNSILVTKLSYHLTGNSINKQLGSKSYTGRTVNIVVFSSSMSAIFS